MEGETTTMGTVTGVVVAEQDVMRIEQELGTIKRDHLVRIEQGRIFVANQTH